MRPKSLLVVAAVFLAGVFIPYLVQSVQSSDRSEDNLRRYFENEPALLKIHLPADKKGVNYYPFRKDKKLDYVGRGVSIFKGATATIYRIKVLPDYIEIQFNEGGGTTAGRIFTRTDWPFEGKNYGGRINVRFDREISSEDLAIPNMVALLSPLFCLVKDYDKNCYMEPLPEKPAPEAEEAPRKAAPTVNITANPPSVRRGECSMLNWRSTNADNVEVSELGTVQVAGNQEVCPEKDTCYEAVASGPGGTATDSACVTVRGPAMDDDFSRGIRDVFFAVDRSNLSQESIATLRSNIEWLQRQPEVQFVVEGHCDERATSEYNIGLGMRRAQSVRNFLIRNGISADRFTIVSYGEERPFATCHNESCWWQNRRAHFAQQ